MSFYNDALKFADKTRDSLNLDFILLTKIQNRFNTYHFNGELSDKPNVSTYNLFSYYKDFLQDYSNSENIIDSYNENWYLIPVLACILVNRGSLKNPYLSLYTLPTESELLDLSKEFGSLNDRYSIIMETLDIVINLCSFDKDRIIEPTNTIMQKIYYRLNKLSYGDGSLLYFSGVILYSLSLTGLSTYNKDEYTFDLHNDLNYRYLGSSNPVFKNIIGWSTKEKYSGR